MSNTLKVALGLAVGLIVGMVLGRTGSIGGAASPSDVSSTNYTQLTTNALTVNTSNSATSTTAVGCIQTTATSTASPVRFVASTTSLVNGVSTGVVLVQFGVCPI